jgi:signal peptidase I
MTTVSETLAPPAAAAPAPAPGGAPRKSLARDYLETILVCVIFVVFSRAFVFQQSKIPSGSMRDTLLEGDYIMVNRFIYAPTDFGWERAILPLRELRRGDVVVFKQPQEPETDYIKRLIGLPGDVVEVRSGYVWVNGEKLEEPYVQDAYRRHGTVNYGPITVRQDSYFVLGDHRDQSYDSREWGQVPRDLVKGRALLIWYSFPEDGDDARPGVQRQVRSWLEKAIFFLPRSRWGRCFHLIR